MAVNAMMLKRINVSEYYDVKWEPRAMNAMMLKGIMGNECYDVNRNQWQ